MSHTEKSQLAWLRLLSKANQTPESGNGEYNNQNARWLYELLLKKQDPPVSNSTTPIAIAMSKWQQFFHEYQATIHTGAGGDWINSVRNCLTMPIANALSSPSLPLRQIKFTRVPDGSLENGSCFDMPTTAISLGESIGKVFAFSNILCFVYLCNLS